MGSTAEPLTQLSTEEIVIRQPVAAESPNREPHDPLASSEASPNVRCPGRGRHQ
jgi:hypothetical protein